MNGAGMQEQDHKLSSGPHRATEPLARAVYHCALAGGATNPATIHTLQQTLEYIGRPEAFRVYIGALLWIHVW